MARRNTRGFTLIELGVVVAVGAAVASLALPSAGRGRQIARARGSASNLLTIGQGAQMYTQDSAGRLHGYSWGTPGAPNSVVYDLPNGDSIRIYRDYEAAAVQHAEILQRRTGRISGHHEINYYDSILPHRRGLQLVLMDYLDLPFPSQLFIDPSDANQLVWASDPLNYGTGSTVPYVNGVPFGYDDSSLWSHTSVRQRWAYEGSYQATVPSWNAHDGFSFDPVYVPVSDTPHLLTLGGDFSPNGVRLSNGRYLQEVAFPAGKVHLFEEFDYESGPDYYFAYNPARCEKLMFDGSVNSLPSGGALPSRSPALPYKFDPEWRQKYVPLDTFPLPVGGLGDNRRFSQKFRWTTGGLRGVDYSRTWTPIVE